MSETVEKSREILDGLGMEVYYGFNMRCVVGDMVRAGKKDELKVIENFIKQCKEGRKG